MLTFQLGQNYPNPFNPYTEIPFSLEMDQIVSLKIYDIQGRIIQSLVDNTNLSAGYHKMAWDGKNNLGLQVPSGMYFYKLKSNNHTLTKKMVVMK